MTNTQIDRAIAKLDEIKTTYHKDASLPWLCDFREILLAMKEPEEKPCEHLWSFSRSLEKDDMYTCRCGLVMLKEREKPVVTDRYGDMGIKPDTITIDRKVAEAWVDGVDADDGNLAQDLDNEIRKALGR